MGDHQKIQESLAETIGRVDELASAQEASSEEARKRVEQVRSDLSATAFVLNADIGHVVEQCERQRQCDKSQFDTSMRELGDKFTEAQKPSPRDPDELTRGDLAVVSGKVEELARMYEGLSVEVRQRAEQADINLADTTSGLNANFEKAVEEWDRLRQNDKSVLDKLVREVGVSLSEQRSAAGVCNQAMAKLEELGDVSVTFDIMQEAIGTLASQCNRVQSLQQRLSEEIKRREVDNNLSSTTLRDLIREFKSPFNRTDNFEGSIVAPGVAETFIRTYQEKKNQERKRKSLINL